MDVANDFPRNGPSGCDSHAWMSRALQSFTSTTPNTQAPNSAGVTRSPGEEGTPTTKPTSASMSRRSDGPKTGAASGAASGAARRCPHGRTTGVPDTTTVPARPW